MKKLGTTVWFSQFITIQTINTILPQQKRETKDVSSRSLPLRNVCFRRLRKLKPTAFAFCAREGPLNATTFNGLSPNAQGGGGTPYDGLYGEAPPERGPFFRPQVYERKGISFLFKRQYSYSS